MPAEDRKDHLHQNEQTRNTNGDEIDIFQLVSIIWKRKKIVLAVTILGTLLSLVISLVAKPVFRSSAKIIPLEEGGRGVIPLAQFSGLLGLGDLGGMFKSKAGIIKAVLLSRELTKRVIENSGIKKYLYIEYWDEDTNSFRKDISEHKIPSLDFVAERFLKDNLAVNDDKKTGTIEIAVIFPYSPTLPYIIVNQYLRELEIMLNEKAYTLAKKNRIFLEERLELARKSLEKAEEDFRKFQEQYNVIEIGKQMEEGVKLYAQFVGLISQKEVELEVLKKITSPENPQVISLEYEIKELRKKLKELDEGQRTQKVSGYVVHRDKRLIIPLENIPDVGLEYLRRRRELEVQTEVYKVLLTSLEKAKIDEAKEDVAFQVIDYPYVPDKRYKPKRKLMVVVGFASSFMLGLFLVFLLEAIESRRLNKI